MIPQELSRRSIVVLPLLCVALALVLALGKTPGVEASTSLSGEPVPSAKSAPAPAPSPDPAAAPAPVPASTTVSLAIDFGDGFEMHYTALPHTPEMTVFDVLQQAAKHAHPLEFKHSGSGSAAFISQFADKANQKGPEAFYWQFRVNGQYAKKGAGAYEVAPGDQVRWFYAKYERAGDR